MLRRVESLAKCSVRATDGAIGRITDCYFDDQDWTVRYLVVDTEMWLGWHVLIAPQAVSAIDWDGNTIDVGLSRAEVERSPRADLQHPLSRLYESEFYTHFGYPPYWDAPPSWGMGPLNPGLGPDPTLAATRAQAAAEVSPANPAVEPGVPAGLAAGDATLPPESDAPLVESAADSHVRSWREVKGYHIDAADGEIGHVDDLLFDEKSWIVRFIEIDTSNWIGGKSVLVPRHALGTVSWPNSTLSVTLTRDQVNNSPRTDEVHLTGAIEEQLADYYKQ